MECDICSTIFGSRGQPTCASCARALVYQARLDRLTNLIDNEKLRNNIGHVVAPPTDFISPSLPTGPELVDITESAKKHAHCQIVRETQAIRVRCTAIDDQVSLLRQQIKQATQQNAARRIDIAHRRTNIEHEKTELTSRVPQLLEPLHASIRRSQRKLDKVHARTVEGRTKLCQETARLAALQQRRRRTSEGIIIHEYSIGGIAIVDLRHLNSAQPQLVNASIANICRLLTTCCHYLSVRLPAEITPPHANYPNPTIFSLQSSYQGFHVHFPGSSYSTPSSSRTLDQRPLPKPRLLHLDRPLATLAKEDPGRYNLFIEGVSLLAWNVAWLCTSQGIDLTSTYQTVCPLGMNLYALFREHTSMDPKPQPAKTKHSAGALTMFGHFSHSGTAHNLASAEGIGVMHNWRTASFTRFLDKIKQALVQDMSGAEWEVISGDDFDREREDEEAVLVGGSRRNRPDTSLGVSNARQSIDNNDPSFDDGKKGYLKLKSRTGEGNPTTRKQQ